MYYISFFINCALFFNPIEGEFFGSRFWMGKGKSWQDYTSVHLDLIFQKDYDDVSILWTPSSYTNGIGQLSIKIPTKSQY